MFVKVKARLDISKFKATLSIFGLVVLVLLSPCKVRNFIQAELGVSLTQVLNKSQSTFSQTTCQVFERSESASTTAKQTLKHPHVLISQLNSVVDFEYLFESSTVSKPLINATAKVPLYLLYLNLKVYS